MPQHPRLRPPIYTFRVRILGGFYAPPGSKAIWRDIEIRADQTLDDLGEAIPLAFEFDDPHLWSFFLSGQAWDQASEYTHHHDVGPGRMDASAAHNAADTAIRDVRLPGTTGKKEFLFLFDYGDEWHFGVKLRGIRENLESHAEFPRLAGQQGESPPQYPDMEEDDEFEIAEEGEG